MQPIFACQRYLFTFRGTICTRSSQRASTPFPKRSWGSSARSHNVHIKARRSRCSLQQNRQISSSKCRKKEELLREERFLMPMYPRIPTKVILQQDDLFHPFSSSPIPEMRRKAAIMKMNAYCPHPSHHQTGLQTASLDLQSERAKQSGPKQPPAHVRYECPDCGIPVYCSEEHWMDDYENHLQICDTLQQINEDEHDLRSGRQFREFEYPGPSIEDFIVNMTNWDTYLYTREFVAINEPNRLRQATRLLTYPMTIGSIIHELSPYNIKQGGRLTIEGLKSLTGRKKPRSLFFKKKPKIDILALIALRYTLHPPRNGEGLGVKGLRVRAPPVRIFVLGARAESSLPRSVWQQFPFLFPNALFHLNLIGPEAMANRDRELPLPPRTAANPFGAVVEDRATYQMKITTFVEYYHTLHKAQLFQPFDPYFDCFVLFHPGLGHPASSHEWEETLPQLLETKVPVICTGYTKHDMDRDRAWVEEKAQGEYDILMEPGENKFRSLRWDLNDLDPEDISCGNWGVWAFRGKRYVFCLWSFLIFLVHTCD